MQQGSGIVFVPCVTMTPVMARTLAAVPGMWGCNSPAAMQHALAATKVQAPPAASPAPPAAASQPVTKGRRDRRQEDEEGTPLHVRRLADARRDMEDEDNVTPVPIEERTTVMLRNMPNNYTPQMLLDMLDGEGFKGDYDFVYMPADFRTRAALGYAFINFVTPAPVARFWQAFDGFKRWAIPSRKVGFVSWCGPHQGFEAHVQRYRNSPVMHSSVPAEHKPMIFKDGVQVPFPAPTRKPRLPRVRSDVRSAK